MTWQNIVQSPRLLLIDNMTRSGRLNQELRPHHGKRITRRRHRGGSQPRRHGLTTNLLNWLGKYWMKKSDRARRSMSIMCPNDS